jgi:DNA-binding Xre family transcriptional regulator
MTVYNRFKILLAEKETREKRRIPYKEIQDQTGIASSSLSAWATNTVNRYDRSTINKLCTFFNCSAGDLIVYEPTQDQAIK